MIGELDLDDAVLAEYHAAGDVALDDVVDPLPGRPALKSLIGMLGHDQAQRLDVCAVGLEAVFAGADEIAAPLETVEQPLGFQRLQGALYRRPRNLKDVGDRPFEQDKPSRQDALDNVGPQNVLGDLIAALRILPRSIFVHGISRPLFSGGGMHRPVYGILPYPS